MYIIVPEKSGKSLSSSWNARIEEFFNYSVTKVWQPCIFSGLNFTGPPNGPVLFCCLASVVVCNTAGVRAGWARANTAWECYRQLGRPAAGHVDSRRAGGQARGNRAADTARRASMVTSR